MGRNGNWVMSAKVVGGEVLVELESIEASRWKKEVFSDRRSAIGDFSLSLSLSLR